MMKFTAQHRNFQNLSSGFINDSLPQHLGNNADELPFDKINPAEDFPSDYSHYFN